MRLLVAHLLLAVMAVTAAQADTPAAEQRDKKKLVIDIPPPKARKLSGVTNPPLTNVRFHLGDTVKLGRVFDPSTQPDEGCIDKPAVAARFCMDLVNWPAPIRAAIELATDDEDTIYLGTRAVIRYDDGEASQAHVMFPTAAFIDVIEHMTARYGPPTEQEINVRPIPGEDEISNTIVRWKSLPGTDNGNVKPLILEVRAYDDVRHTLPDRQHGFLWLHREGATPVFRHFTTVDLMVLRQRRLGQWPREEDAGD